MVLFSKYRVIFKFKIWHFFTDHFQFYTSNFYRIFQRKSFQIDFKHQLNNQHFYRPKTTLLLNLNDKILATTNSNKLHHQKNISIPLKSLISFNKLFQIKLI